MIIKSAPNYRIDIDGNVWSIKRKRNVKSHVSNSGYMQVFLRVDNKTKCFQLHRLIAEAFIPNPFNKPEVNHSNGDKTDNTVLNLEWCTRYENLLHSMNMRGYRLNPDIREPISRQDKFNELVDSGVSIENALYSLN